MIGVVLAVEPQHPRDLRFVGPPPGRLAEPPVAQALRTLLMQPVAPAPQRTLAHPQHLRRLVLSQLAPSMPLPPPHESHLPHPPVNSSSEERRGGKEDVRTCESRGAP